MGDAEDLERRVNLTAQVARLEEKTVSLQEQITRNDVNQREQLARIERLLNQQASSMEKMMGEFTQKIDKLDNSLDEKTSPLKSQIENWKGAVLLLVGIMSVLVAPILIFLLTKAL